MPLCWSCRSCQDATSLVASNQSTIIADFSFEALAALGRNRTAHQADPPFGLAQVSPRLILRAFCVVASHGRHKYIPVTVDHQTYAGWNAFLSALACSVRWVRQGKVTVTQ